MKEEADMGKDPGTYKISDPSWAFLLVSPDVLLLINPKARAARYCDVFLFQALK